MRALRALLVVCPLAACGRWGFDGDGDDVVTAPQLTIEMSGAGYGTVVGTSGIQCTTTCTIDVPAGTAVNLRGLASTGDWFAGWGGPCGGNFDCDFVVDGDVTVDVEFSPRPNRVFITDTDSTGAFGGLAVADTICNDMAVAAGLDGTFVAYLSDASTDAVSRLAGSRGWIRTDGAPVADLATDFASGPFVFPIRLDEHVNDIGKVAVFTGTRNGNHSVNTCLDWSSADPAENADAGWSSWGSHFATGVTTHTCDELHHLMCAEIGKNVPVGPRPDLGRQAFVTVGRWAPGGGLGSADAVCASEATAGGLTGSFRAALATSAGSIESRFAAGPPWRRVDGVRLMRDDRLFDVDYLDVAPEVDRAGTRVSSDFWTGARRWNEIADVGENCSDWTSNLATANGHMGYTSETDVTNSVKFDACSYSLPLLCLEQ